MKNKHLSLVPNTGSDWPVFSLDMPVLTVIYTAPKWKQLYLRGEIIQEYPRPLDDFELMEQEFDREEGFE